MKKIVLTGGGTAGHVTPNIALLPALQAAGYEIAYVGSYEGIEKKLIADFNIPYTGISTGKFRRYLDPKNFSDPFRVMKGFVEARNYLKNYQPDVVFSKGGFVSVPVVRAAASLHIPCIIHESDMTPGLANKLCIPVAEKVCCNFPETMKNIPADKAVLTGSPIRAELAQGSRLAGLNMCGFTANKPVIMVIGGSLGAANVNKAVRDALPKLLEDFQVVHLDFLFLQLLLIQRDLQPADLVNHVSEFIVNLLQLYQISFRHLIGEVPIVIFLKIFRKHTDRLQDFCFQVEQQHGTGNHHQKSNAEKGKHTSRHQI